MKKAKDSSLYSQHGGETRKVSGAEILLGIQDSSDKISTEGSKEDLKILLFNNLLQTHLIDERFQNSKTAEEWIDEVFLDAEIYEGSDEILWGPFLICIKIQKSTGVKSALIVDKLGVSFFKSLDISKTSQFYSAIDNLDPKYKDVTIRKCLAVSLLQKYMQLSKEQVNRIKSQLLKYDYDQTHAGELANRCVQIFLKNDDTKIVGNLLLSLGLLEQRSIHSTLLDVVYSNENNKINLNNKLVYHLGDQLEQLFDPLTEYSPEQTEYTYKPPEIEQITDTDSILTKAICNELMQFQIKFALNLVDFLQKFLITLRVDVLNENIEGLSTIKLNRLFPPTIDEVTRINCIFLDSLKSATTYGSLEILKACSVTIPYFYKAYTRHEAATKNYSKDIKLFLKTFAKQIPLPEIYTEMKIETIIKGPQEKLMKLKLIIDRLWKSSNWSSEKEIEAKKYYDNVVDTIHTFGTLKEPISSYNTRVFTPSGKILTELAKSWPVELQYKWLKRRVVGVFDIMISTETMQRSLLIIFSDYIVFLDILDSGKYYAKQNSNKPLLSDILMNSLINEVPLPSKIPTLKVKNYCYIDRVFVSTFNDDTIRFDSFDSNSVFSVSCKLASKVSSTSIIADLITKATILEKDTAFHLFRASQNKFHLYSTAHEMDAYICEKLKSKYALFLNMEPSKKLLETHKLHMAIFANIVGDPNSDIVKLNVITSDKRKYETKVPSNELLQGILYQLSFEIPICFSSLHSPFFNSLLKVNRNIIESMKTQNENEPGDEFENTRNVSETSTNNSFLKGHKKERSYGTITTFRSYKSDLKESTIKKKASVQPKNLDVVPEMKDRRKQEKSHELKSKTKPEMKLQKTSNKPAIKKSPVKQEKSREKRKSIVNIFRGIFGKDNKKSNKPTDSPRNKDGNQATKPSHKVLENTKSSKFSKKYILEEPKKIGSNIAKESNIHEQNEDDSKSVNKSSINKKTSTKPPIVHTVSKRISSVVRNSQYASEKEIPDTYVEKYTEKEQSIQHDDSSLTHIISINIINDEKLKKEAELDDRDIADKTFDDDPFGNYAIGDDQRIEEVIKITSEKESFKENNTEYKSKPSFLEANAQETNKPLPAIPIVDPRTLENISSSRSNLEEPKQKTTVKREISNYCQASSKLTNTSDPVSKKSIFPIIPQIDRKSIDFSRSASYRELFDMTRLVFDEIDVQYNWKRVPNESSLSKTNAITNDPSIENLPTKANEGIKRKITGLGTVAEIEDDEKRVDKSTSSINIKPSHLLNVQYNQGNTTTDFLEDIEHIVDNVLKVNKSFSNSKNLRAGGFKVVRTSSPKIINKNFEEISEESIKILERTASFRPHNDPALHKSSDSNVIDEEVISQEEKFHTPLSDVTASFEVEKNYQIDEKSIEVEKLAPGLIEDFDFSSFRMSFDETAEDIDQLSVISNTEQLNSIMKNKLSPHPFANNEPIIYYLPSSLTNNSLGIFNTNNNIFGTRNIKNNEEDIIWVSPNKIGLYDISKLSESSIKIREQNFNDRGQFTALKRSESSTLSSELSYSYLANIINSPDDINNENSRKDKPVRLEFHE